MEFQLKITKKVRLSTKRSVNVTTVFTWADREDAIECKKLIDRAEKDIRNTKVIFVEHTPDIPLEV